VSDGLVDHQPRRVPALDALETVLREDFVAVGLANELPGRYWLS